jgi:hypothetical protein
MIIAPVISACSSLRGLLAEECIAVTLRYTCNMKLVHDPGGRVRRDLAADVKGYALFGGSRREYRYVLRRVGFHRAALRTWGQPGREVLRQETCGLQVTVALASLQVGAPQ